MSATLVLGLSAATTATAHAASAGVRPNKVGELDCNGLSPVQRPVKSAVQCADPRGSDEGRFEENGHYIGHDEPSVRFISSQPGSGDNTTLIERLPVEPSALPTVRHPGRDVTHTFELTIAPWLSTTVCDPQSTPMLPCSGVRRQRAEWQLSGCGRSVRGAAVLPARLRPLRRQHQL